MSTNADNTLIYSLQRLEPIIHEVDTVAGKRSHAAFQVSFKINLPLTTAVTRTNLLDLVDNFLVKNRAAGLERNPRDTSGAEHLLCSGIPSTYASSFDELEAFLGTASAEIIDLKIADIVVVFKTKERSKSVVNKLPISLTFRYGPQAYQRVLSGNYREVRVEYPTTFSSVPFIESVVNVQKGNAIFVVGNASDIDALFNCEFSHASITLEFVMIDMRQHVSA